MVLSLADHHKVVAKLFEGTGALDPILGIDTQLFIDPKLLAATAAPELQNSASKVTEHFCDVLRVLENVKHEGDVFWRKADKLLTFPEMKGLCIGYSGQGVNGRGMGKVKRTKLLRTVHQIVQAGSADPAIFELVGAFEGGIGPDLISDMIAKIIMPDLIQFTQRVCSDTGIPLVTQRLGVSFPSVDLPTDPYNKSPIVLIPKDILRDLPVAETIADVFWIAEQNDLLRSQLNNIVGQSWKQRSVTEQKHGLKTAFINDPQTLAQFIAAYLKQEAQPYDFSDDPKGETSWYRLTKGLPNEFALPLTLSKQPTIDEVLAVVLRICEHYRKLMEDNQLCRLIYDKRKDRKHESAAQLIFFGVASAYCEANNLDLTPEANAGRGPVDFKVSSGFKGRVLVEMKLTSNANLTHGFTTQLPIYQKAEGTLKGVYLVVDNGGASVARMLKFREAVAVAAKEKQHAPIVIEVDGQLQKSASKADEDEAPDEGLLT